MPDQLIQLEFRKPLVRAAAILFLALAFLWMFFVLRWYLGNTLAEYFNQDDTRPDLAKLAVDLAPNDPLPHWRLGDFTEKKLPPDQIMQAVSEYERAVTLSPHDYRFWMSFGRALERAGEIERGEKALRRAVELAPSYSYPHWYLGNLLLRDDRYEEGFVELQRASEADPELRPQLFNLAWQVFKDDPESLKTAVGKAAETRAQFALHLIAQQKTDLGIPIWKSLSEVEKVRNRTSGEAIINRLMAGGKIHLAAEVWNEIAPGQNYRVAVGRIQDGGFESGIKQGASGGFGWQVKSQDQVQISIEPNVANSGSHSLRLVFRVRASVGSLGVTHLVPVEPNKQYELEYYFKTAKLESAGAPVLVITDARGSGTLALSESAPTGTNDWQRVALSFKTGPTTEAVVLTIGRAACTDTANCPMFGTIWYDDFNLKLGA